jgi:protein tyrosine phosphatase (PTP) superfamily phosphohydrolase (DUF442 family)
MSIGNICNYVRLTDTIATSGQPLEHEFGDIAHSGFVAVINLAMPNSHNAIPEEGGIVAARGMSYFHIPVPFEAPATEHLRQFIAVMEMLKGRPVWAHCALNYRVSAFMRLYQRLTDGVPAEVGQSVMFERWQPDAVWRRFLDTDGSPG